MLFVENPPVLKNMQKMTWQNMQKMELTSLRNKELDWAAMGFSCMITCFQVKLTSFTIGGPRAVLEWLSPTGQSGHGCRQTRLWNDILQQETSLVYSQVISVTMYDTWQPETT